MIIKRYVRGFVLAVLMLSAVSFVVEALTIDSTDPAGPSGTVVPDNVSASRTFRIQVNESANFTWYINGTPITSSEVDVKINATRSNYTNTSAGLGYWNITVDAVVFNGTDTKSHTWLWNVTSVPAPEYFNTTPIFTTPPTVINITDTSADISFTVNQSDALTIVRYGTTALVNESWQNGTGKSRKIPLTGLTKGTTYNYSVYAYNGSNQSYSLNSPINSFTTTNPTAPNITNISTDVPTASSVNISFSVNQSDAKTRVYYGLTEALELGGSGWKNNTISPITTMLSNLNSGTKYYYSVFAYNGSNQSYFSNSSIQNFTTIAPTAPNITNITTSTPTDSSVDIIFSVNQSDAKTRVYFGLTEALELGGSGWKNNTISPITITLSNLSNATKYYYSIYAYNGSNQSYFSNSTINNFTTKYPAPKILSTSPNTPWQTIGIASVNFTVTFDQIVNVSWLINGSSTGVTNTSVTSSYYLNITPATGTWNITVVGNNTNGTVSFRWLWTVRPKTYETGNRIWDANKVMNLTYTWNPMSFYAFYYDVDNNVGNESLKIFLDSRDDRNIQENTLRYFTAPENVSFKYKPWGYYNVIGFMAEKYFAAYTASTSKEITNTALSTMGSKQLHKILMDDDTRRTVYAGSTLTLSEGYVLKVKDVDITGGKIVLLSLLKDGNEIDTTAVQQGNTYVYTKRVGSVSDLPIIAVRIETVFSGKEANAAFMKGIFQISESFTSVNQGNRYGIMEITSASDTGITMANKNSLSLSPNSVNDVMGDIKIIVADNSSVLRFAPTVKKSGTYEVRGTISQSTDTTFDWNPLNFEGFYYDINEDVGSEKLSLTRSGRTIDKDNMVYTTAPQSVSFKFKGWGNYNVIGFMADKYFAAYTASTSKDIISTPLSPIGSKQLHKVLADDDTRRTVYAGSTLTLNEGYVLKVKDVDITGGKIVLLSLLKDGNEIDTTAVQQGNTYVYTKRVGSVSDLPIIAARIETVFSGKEATAAFMKGIFQLSENYVSANTGDQFGAMKVSEVSDTKIEMKNTGTVSLSTNSIVDVMGNIKFKVADSNDVRFYPFIMVNGSVAAANQLAIDAPPNPSVKDTITITVTAGGTPVSGASVSFDDSSIGTTNSTGRLDYTLAKSGMHNITATKLGYEKATKTIQVSEWVDNRLSIEVPAIIDQGIAVSIKVLSNGSAIAGASVTFDNSAIGTTDAKGILNYTFNVGGTHNLGASKDKYISVVREINVRLPFSEYKALDISIIPSVVFTNVQTVIRSNITNTGTKADTKPIELIINGTVADNRTVALAPGEVTEVNFTQKEALPGNYTVEILGQTGLLEVREEPFNLLLIGGIATVFGAIIIYLLTAKSKLSIELIRQKLFGKVSTEITPPKTEEVKKQ